jgi:hypothetical protein
MGIDKLKLAGTIKLCTIGFYLIYLIFFNTSLNIYLPSNKSNDAALKENLITDYCLLIIGGSNVRQGISAQLLSESICPALNLSVNMEMGFFNLYLNWLAKNLTGKKYKNVIYSPAIFWGDKLIINENSGFIDLPGVSIFTQLKSIFVDTKSIFNSRGDIESYSCASGVVPFNIKEIDFISSNAIVAQEIKRRVSILGSITGANSIYVRVPPVYVKTERQAELYTKLIDGRIEILKGLGVKIVGSTIVSTDSSLFCDSFHANAKGREVFTMEIRLP